MKKKNIQLAVGLLIGGIFMYMTLRQVDFHNVAHYISQANWGWAVAGAFVYCSAFLLRAVRWQHLLEPIKPIEFKKSFAYLILGYFMNNVLPLRMGEFLRAFFTGTKLGISRTGVFATIVVERIFDGVAYICLFLLTVLILPFPQWARGSLIGGSILFFGVLTILILLSHHQEKVMKLYAYIPVPAKIKPRLEKILNNFITGLSILTDWKMLLLVIVVSIAVWAIEGTVFYMFSHAFHLTLSIFQCFLVMIVIGLGCMLPPAPGFVGTVEFLGVTSLSFMGINKNQAFGYILVLHFTQLLAISVLGVRTLIVEKISFGSLLQAGSQE